MISEKEFLDIYSQICNEANFTDRWCYVRSQDVMNVVRPSAHGEDNAQQVLSKINPLAAQALAAFLKGNTSGFLYEVHFNIAVAVALAIKHYICPDASIGIECETSKYADRADLWWVISSANPGGRLIKSRAAYNTQLKIGRFPLHKTVSFVNSESNFDDVCAIIETLQVEDPLSLQETDGRYYVCKGDIKLGSIKIDQSETEVIKKHTKRISVYAETVIPLSKRSKTTKYPALDVCVRLLEEKKKATPKTKKHNFKGKVCRVIGDFSYGDRNAVEHYITRCGGRCTSTLTLENNMLVVGTIDSENPLHKDYEKEYAKALARINYGLTLSIYKEEDLF